MTDENTQNTATEGPRREEIPWRNVANVAGVVLLVAVVVPFVVFAVPQVVGADQSYVVLSGSMEPAMSPGDVIIVNSVPASAIERNDVITFGGQEGDTPTTHRVIEVVEQDGTTAFRTQGDANEDPDSGLVSPDAVLGRVTLTIPLIGYVVLWVNTPVGYITLVLLPIGLFLGNELLTWARAGDDVTDVENTENGDTAPEKLPDGKSTLGSTSHSVASGSNSAEESTVRANAGQATPSAGSGGVPAVDLKLSGLSLAVLAAYAGWTVSTEIATKGAPSSLSVAVLTGGVLGFASVVWIVVRGWLSRRQTRSAAPLSPNGTDRTPDDGGADSIGRTDSNAFQAHPTIAPSERDDDSSTEDHS